MSVSESGMPEFPGPMVSTWTRPDLKFGANWVASADAASQDRILNSLTEGELLALPFLFEFWALPHQLPPEGDWRSWVILGGRGAGKTRAGAEWVRSMVEGSRPLQHGKARRVALVGETIDQAREVMVFGESGILACTPPDRQPRWEATRKRLVWDNGAEARLFSAHDPEALRGPQFDAAWCDEFGCAAIDKGSNQPNKFLDPKSSESGLPHYSTGERDELIQRQYFRAMLRHWKDEFNNPVSALYGAPMIDMGHAYAWAWDARPYPAFPTNSDLWSDAGNYATGHWLNGRSSGKALSAVLKAYCAGAGVEAVDAEQAYGIVRGYLSDGGDTPRSEIQPLLLAYGIDAFESEGQIVFRSRTGRTDVVLDPETLVERDGQGDFESARSAEGEEAGRVRVGFLGADGEFEPVWEDASQADSEAAVVSVSEFPLVLTRSEGRLVAERWLSEGKVARDRVNFSVPPSCVDAKVGRVIDVGDGAKYRIDRVESTESKQIEAVKVDPEAYRLARIEDEPPVIAPYLAPVPVFPLFLDLPLISGNEDPFSPHVAVTASPWPGQVGVFRENATGTFDLSHVISEKATVGRTESILTRATGGVIDRGPDLQVKMASGTLDSASWASVLNGANRIAIGSGASDEWEVLQFAEAELIAPDTYLLKNRLRGQFGTDAFAPDEWPVGSIIVLLNEALGQVALSPSERERSQRFRTGPVSRAIDDASFVETEAAFSGVGLRPFSPCHLHKNGDLFTWVRRTRVGGDAWTTPSVPIGEESEVYVVRVLSNGQILREAQTTSPSWTYDAGARAEDGNLTAYSIAVAQVSAVFGTGGAAVLDVVE